MLKDDRQESDRESSKSLTDRLAELMWPPARIEFPPLPAGLQCPNCDYSLEGLPARTRVCPECGNEVTQAAYAMRDTRWEAKQTAARHLMLISPMIGVFGGTAVSIATGDRVVPGVLFLFLTIWMGSALAIHSSTAVPGSRLSIREIALGLPLGLAYSAVVFGITAVVLWTVYVIAP